MKLLEVDNLTVCFYQDQRCFTAIDRLSFSIEEGEFFSLIGESGSGKTVTALAILGLLEDAPGIVEGSIRLQERELLPGLAACCRVERSAGAVRAVKKDPRWRRIHRNRVEEVRGKKIALIFQEPLSALDPYFTVGEQLSEVLQRGKLCRGKKEARQLAEHWLEKVALKHPRAALDAYPHELSGGMAQRVMIALALCSEPQLLIADEPTTALDATIQKEIMLLLQDLKERLNLTILFITHDVRLVSAFADRAAVLYRGHLVETGRAMELVGKTNLFIHPFTETLLNPFGLKREISVSAGAGSPNDSSSPGNSACVYYRGCPTRLPRCREQAPPQFYLNDTHRAACWLCEPSPQPGEHDAR